MSRLVDRQLQKIEELAKQKQEEIDLENYQKYKGIYDVVIHFLQKEDVLMYGGMAINEMMPDKYKFYDEHVLPDIDVFTHDAMEIGQRLIKVYQEKGYKNPAIKRALHKNTFKFFVAGLQILDLTEISHETFLQLKKGSTKKSMKIPIVNKEFLRLSLHAILSQPKDAHRWSKIYERLVKFYTIYPPKTMCVSSKATLSSISKMENMIKDIMYMLQDSPYILFGGLAIELFLGMSPSKGAAVNIIAEGNLREIAEQFISKLKQHYDGIELSPMFEDDSVVCEHVLVLYKSKPFLGIYKPGMCVSYVTHKKYRIASIHTMCRMYTMMMLSGHKHHDRAQTRCFAEMLTRLQLRLVKEPSRKRLLKQFVLECYGAQPGLITLRRNFLD